MRPWRFLVVLVALAAARPARAEGMRIAVMDTTAAAPPAAIWRVSAKACSR